MADTKTFAESATEAGLKQGSITKLGKEDFDTHITVHEMGDEDIRAVGLTRDQTGVLQGVMGGSTFYCSNHSS